MFPSTLNNKLENTKEQKANTKIEPKTKEDCNLKLLLVKLKYSYIFLILID